MPSPCYAVRLLARAERELLELENSTPGNFSVGKRIGCLIDLVGLKRSVTIFSRPSRRFLPIQNRGKSRSGAHEPPMLPIKCFSLTRRSTALISAFVVGTPRALPCPRPGTEMTAATGRYNLLHGLFMPMQSKA